MSATRRRYMICLFARIIIFIIGLFMCKDAQNFEILEGNNFFKEFDILHLLWVVWVCDMIYQILPIKIK